MVTPFSRPAAAQFLRWPFALPFLPTNEIQPPQKEPAQQIRSLPQQFHDSSRQRDTYYSTSQYPSTSGSDQPDMARPLQPPTDPLTPYERKQQLLRAVPPVGHNGQHFSEQVAPPLPFMIETPFGGPGLPFTIPPSPPPMTGFPGADGDGIRPILPLTLPNGTVIDSITLQNGTVISGEDLARLTTPAPSSSWLKPGKRTPVVQLLTFLQNNNFSGLVTEQIIEKQNMLRQDLQDKGVEPKLTSAEVETIWEAITNTSQRHRQDRLSLSAGIAETVLDAEFPSLAYLTNGSISSSLLEPPGEVPAQVTRFTTLPIPVPPGMGMINRTSGTIPMGGEPMGNFTNLNGELDDILNGNGTITDNGAALFNGSTPSPPTSTLAPPVSKLEALARYWNATTIVLGEAKSAKYGAKQDPKNEQRAARTDALLDLADAIDTVRPVILETPKLQKANSIATSVEDILTLQWLAALDDKATNISTSIFDTIVTTPIHGDTSIADKVLSVNQSDIQEVIEAAADVAVAKSQLKQSVHGLKNKYGFQFVPPETSPPPDEGNGTTSPPPDGSNSTTSTSQTPPAVPFNMSDFMRNANISSDTVATFFNAFLPQLPSLPFSF